MNFLKYPHLERFGNDEVQGIEFGECWIFPKLDGANAQMWWDDKYIQYGSRNRDLAGGNDNRGFREALSEDIKFRAFFDKYPDHRLYGEWLVPHAFQGYRDDAWRRFWIFDVHKRIDSGAEHFIPYDVYEPMLREFGLDYVIPINRVTNPDYESLLKFLDKATFLCKDGGGPGEGIVIKNYGFYNKFGNQTWAKLVRQEYKELHTKHHGVDELKLGRMVEEEIVEQFVTRVLVDKEYTKIAKASDGWTSRSIPRLLDTVFYCLVNEELWNALKDHKNPTINFKTLKALTIQRVKQLRSDLF